MPIQRRDQPGKSAQFPFTAQAIALSAPSFGQQQLKQPMAIVLFPVFADGKEKLHQHVEQGSLILNLSYSSTNRRSCLTTDLSCRFEGRFAGILEDDLEVIRWLFTTTSNTSS